MLREDICKLERAGDRIALDRLLLLFGNRLQVLTVGEDRRISG
jgi:hypothetical protein